MHLLPNGLVKIMDFGLAKVSGSDMTATGTVMGTPHYMAPEQVRGLKTDARSDVFAVGCVIYEMLIGPQAVRRGVDARGAVQGDPGGAAAARGGRARHAGGARADRREGAREEPGRALPERRRDARVAAPRPPGARERARARARGRPRAHARGAGGAAAAPAVARRRALPAEHLAHGTSRHSVPPRSSGGRGLLVVGLAAALLALVGGAFVLRRFTSPPAAPTPAPGVQTMARELADTRAKLARRKLDGGDFAGAIRDAERALEMDTANAEARAILEAATALRRRVDEAIAVLRAATSDPARADAALAVMQLDPANAEAETAARAVGTAFRGRAEQARALAVEARRAAEGKGRGNEPAADEAAGLAAQGEQALRANDPVLAARRFLEARARYQQAAR